MKFFTKTLNDIRCGRFREHQNQPDRWHTASARPAEKTILCIAFEPEQGGTDPAVVVRAMVHVDIYYRGIAFDMIPYSYDSGERVAESVLIGYDSGLPGSDASYSAVWTDVPYSGPSAGAMSVSSLSSASI